MKRNRLCVTLLAAAAVALLPPLTVSAAIDAKWIPAEADYVISFDLEKLQRLAQRVTMQKTVEEGEAMAALQQRMKLPPESAVSAMFAGGGRHLRGLLIETTLSEKKINELLMRQPGVKVEKIGGRLFYILPPVISNRNLNHPLAISLLKKGLLLVTFEKYAAPYLEALKRGSHPEFQSTLKLAQSPVWLLIELQKISAEEIRKNGRRSADSNAYLQLGQNIYRLWGVYLLENDDLDRGKIAVEALCRDSKTAKQVSFPLQMVAAMGINMILPEDPDVAAKITGRMRPRLNGSSCIIDIKVDRALWQMFSSALARQYRDEPEIKRNMSPESRRKIRQRQ